VAILQSLPPKWNQVPVVTFGLFLSKISGLAFMESPITAPQNAHLLSERLSGVLAWSFFRPLARPSAPVYMDCADRLERAADEGGELSHSDAIAIRDCLLMHPRQG
jgi:hypothetical protein